MSAHLCHDAPLFLSPSCSSSLPEGLAGAAPLVFDLRDRLGAAPFSRSSECSNSLSSLAE